MTGDPLTPQEPEQTSEPTPSRGSPWPIGFATLAVAFIASQLLDYATAQGLSSTEPRGYFAEVNPVLAQIQDPVTRQVVGFGLKVAVVILVICVCERA